MEQITIAGEVFNAPLRYEEGHELTAGEAGALNQTYHENLRNNFAKRVKDAKENGGFNLEVLQTEFDEYAKEYVFGVRTGGGPVRDPVMAEAMTIAKSRVRAAIKAKGIKQTDVTAAAVTEAARKFIAKNPQILEQARQRVEEAQAAATADLDDLVASMKIEAA